MEKDGRNDHSTNGANGTVLGDGGSSVQIFARNADSYQILDSSTYKQIGLRFASQDLETQKKQAKGMISRLACINLEGGRNEVVLLNLFKTLRSCIQSTVKAPAIFAEAGAIQMLLKRLETKDTSSFVVLHALASLGYLLQQSPERAEIFVKENGLDVMVTLLRTENSTEAVLLLGIQVITFVVQDSAHRLELFQAKRGIDTMCSVLQRGCIKSSLLNERATNLLSVLINLNPRRGPALCCRLLKRIGQLVSRFDSGEESTPRSESDHLNDQIHTLVQSLGYLLEKKPERCESVLNNSGTHIFLKLLDSKTPDCALVETVLWTICYCIEGSKERTLRFELLNVSSRILEIIKTGKTNEGLMCACARALNHLLAALLSDPALSKKATDVCVMLRRILLLSTSNKSKQFLYATPNAMRVIRQLIKHGDGPVTLLRDTGVFKAVVELARFITKTPKGSECKLELGSVIAKINVQQDVLQELGLMAEGDIPSALVLSKVGALDALCAIVKNRRDSSILCSATRALACFVEHSGTKGTEITNIATNAGCDKALLELITSSNDRSEIDDEVLLNTVGALGYMVKRQKLDSTTMKEKKIHLERTSSDHAEKSMKLSDRRKQACRALVSILRRVHASESLLWNVTWALIYLMDDGRSRECIAAVYESGGIGALKHLMERDDGSPSILNSAARALSAIVKVYEDKTKDLSLEIRMSLLAISIRGEADELQSHETQNPEIGNLIEIAIDPCNLADSSICSLAKIPGIYLRSKGIRIHYISKDMDQVGIDAGGLRRDWLSRLSAELFDPKFNLVIWGFNPADSVQLSPKPDFGGLPLKEQKQWYRLMGRILGLSILYQDPLGVALAPPMCKLIFGVTPEFEDIKHVSEEYYNTFSNLNKYRNKDRTAFEEALAWLPFSVNSREFIMEEAFERNSIQQEISLQKRINSKAVGCPYIRKEVNQTKYRSIAEITDALSKARQKKDRDAVRKLTILQNSFLRNGKVDKNCPFSGSDTRSCLSLTSGQDLNDQTRSLQEKFKLRSKRKGEVLGRQRNCKLQRMMSDVVEGGAKKEINSMNYDSYLKLLTHKLLVENSEFQTKAVCEGLHEIIPRPLLHKFLNPLEFAQLIEGDRDISVHSWKQHTKYRGGDETTEQVVWFWDYVKKLHRKSRQKVLQWSTGWRSIGKSGFGHRKFTIELTPVYSQVEDERLPSVATCGFHMWLPKYSSRIQLERKFDIAICETAFGNC